MSSYNPDIHHRRSIRLKGYDYSQAGLYFVTICVNNREHLFGEIIDGEMKINEAGRMIEEYWNEIAHRFENSVLHEYAVMPNHFHAIIELVGAIPRGCPAFHNEILVDKRVETSPTPTIIEPVVGAIPCGCPAFHNKILVDKRVETSPTPTIIESVVGAISCGCPAFHNEILVDKRVETSPTPTISDIICAFKSLTTNEYIRNVRQNNWKSFEKKLWQRNYHEHIIRNEAAYLKIAEYVQTNPQRWLEDHYFEIQT